MPKLIDYPRTTYSGAWELSEIVDDTGGKCAIETAARKLNRKVSGSFKAIIGSAVKFGILTSKRDLLTTTTLFKRIKHAYDKQEELTFHREAFLTPPLFTQLCRKFRLRELPVQMLDVMLIREFGVEEINAQGVAKAFVEGCRMVGLLDEQNMVSDIDALNAKQAPRRELASRTPTPNSFRNELSPITEQRPTLDSQPSFSSKESTEHKKGLDSEIEQKRPVLEIKDSLNINDHDAISTLFGLSKHSQENTEQEYSSEAPSDNIDVQPDTNASEDYITPVKQNSVNQHLASRNKQDRTYHIQISGPSVNTDLEITEVEDINLAIALLEKIRRQLRH